MLKITNKTLSSTNPIIKSSDSIIELKSDIDATYIGVLELTNGSKKTIQFINDGEIYKARLIINVEELTNIKNSKFYVVMISGLMNEKTNMIHFKFDIEMIKKDIRVSTSNDIEEIKIKLQEIDNVVDSLRTNKTIQDLNLAKHDAVKKGMVPVTIDDNGTCIFMYPFSEHIKIVNGQKAINGVVDIDSSMIKYKLGKTIETALSEHAQAIASLGDALKIISENQKEIRKHLDELDIQLAKHINDGII